MLISRDSEYTITCDMCGRDLGDELGTMFPECESVLIVSAAFDWVRDNGSDTCGTCAKTMTRLERALA